MKKILTALVLFATSFANAHGIDTSRSIYASPAYSNHHHYHSNANGVLIGVLGGIAINEAYRRSTQPPVIVQQPVVVQPVPQDPCGSSVYYDGVYNPPAAQAYCRGQYRRQVELQRELENEAYRRGMQGQ